jgi:hypothetical protein
LGENLANALIVRRSRGFCGILHEHKKELPYMSDSITTVNFEDENGDLITMEVIAQASKDGKEYILVADPEDDLAYILEATYKDDETVTYRMVSEDAELRSLGVLFDELMEDVDIEFDSEQ